MNCWLPRLNLAHVCIGSGIEGHLCCKNIIGTPILEHPFVIYGGFKPFLEDPVKPVNAKAMARRRRVRAGRGARQRLAEASPKHAAGRNVAGAGGMATPCSSGNQVEELGSGQPERRRSRRPSLGRPVGACMQSCALAEACVRHGRAFWLAGIQVRPSMCPKEEA